MSEGVSAVLRSNQALSPKRSRAKDSDSDSSTGRSSCRWAGCRRPGRLENDGGTHHPFCSPTHRDFFMADLYEVIQHGGAHVIEQPSGICKLPGCNLPVCEENSATGKAYDFCRRTHAVQYKEDMAEQWGSQGRLCKFGPCFNHVAVHETPKKIDEHCCIKHIFDAAGARGKQAAAAERASLPRQDRPIDEPAQTNGGKGPSCSNEFRQLTISEEAPQQGIQAKIVKERGYHTSVAEVVIEECLRHLFIHPEDFLQADPKGLFCVGKDPTEFHPFEEVTEHGGFQPRYYLYYLSGKQRSTKQGFAWKRSGQIYESKVTSTHLKAKYYNYELKEKKGSSKDDHIDGHVLAYRQFEEARKANMLKKGTKKRWRMTEYSLSDKLVKELSEGKLQRTSPVISKIFQDREGLPVWPPAPQEETCDRDLIANTAVAVSEAAVHVEGMGMSNSYSSSASPPSEGLPPAGEILQGYSNESQDVAPVPMRTFPEELPVWPQAPQEETRDMDVIANASVAVSEVAIHVEGTGMSSSYSSNTSPPSEGLPRAGEILQGYSNESQDVAPVLMRTFPDGGFLAGLPVWPQVPQEETRDMDVNSNAVVAVSDVAFHVEGMGMSSSYSSNASPPSEGLPRAGEILQGYSNESQDVAPVLMRTLSEERFLARLLVWPQAPQEETRDMDVNSNAVVAVSKVAFHVKGTGMSNSYSSNASPPSERLPPAGETFQGYSNESQDVAPVPMRTFLEERFLARLPVWPQAPQEETRDMDVNSNAVAVSEVAFHVKGMGMCNSYSSNASPPSEGLPPAGETLQGYSNKSQDFAPVPMRTFPEERSPDEEWEMIVSRCCSTSQGQNQHQMNWDYSFLDPSPYESKDGDDNIVSNLSGDFGNWCLMDEVNLWAPCAMST